jgi:hypothetical protein
MMLVVPIMVTSSANGLETIATLGIRNRAGDDEIADYEVTVDGILRANVIGFERDRGATALVREALEAIELLSDRSKTFISRSEQRRHNP